MHIEKNKNINVLIYIVQFLKNKLSSDSEDDMESSDEKGINIYMKI